MGEMNLRIFTSSDLESEPNPFGSSTLKEKVMEPSRVLRFDETGISTSIFCPTFNASRDLLLGKEMPCTSPAAVTLRESPFPSPYPVFSRENKIRHVSPASMMLFPPASMNLTEPGTMVRMGGFISLVMLKL